MEKQTFDLPNIVPCMKHVKQLRNCCEFWFKYFLYTEIKQSGICEIKISKLVNEGIDDPSFRLNLSPGMLRLKTASKSSEVSPLDVVV
jgi:hypothetical protein